MTPALPTSTLEKGISPEKVDRLGCHVGWPHVLHGGGTGHVQVLRRPKLNEQGDAVKTRRVLILALFLTWTGTAAAQTDWVPYEGNPVIPRAEADSWAGLFRWVEAVVVVDGFYHMFFTGTQTAFWVDHTDRTRDVAGRDRLDQGPRKPGRRPRAIQGSASSPPARREARVRDVLQRRG